MSELLLQSARVALAAYLHDLGKFSQRAGVNENNSRLPAHTQLYCPRTRTEGRPNQQGYPTHLHAAHTALSFETIEPFLKSLISGDVAPFTKDDVNSLVNVASRHHKPETFLDWVVARADRLASGFERERFEQYNSESEENTGVRNYRQARLLCLFEQISNPAREIADVKYIMPLKPLAPETVFPKLRNEIFPNSPEAATKEYGQLWESFVNALEKMDPTVRESPTLAFDAFDTLWLQHTHCIPAATVAPTRPDVSLYDHSRSTAALAVALWRWHSAAKNQSTDEAKKALANEDISEMEKNKFLLIQGDFTGIQNFIFGATPRVNKKSADTLRGKSFFVNLLCETTAISLLDALHLPSVCQVINAAGKFLIVAPNTDEVRLQLQECREELDSWFVQKTLGIAGVVIASIEASQADFIIKDEGIGFRSLMKNLFESLEFAKFQKFNTTSGKGTHFGALSADYSSGACDIDTRLPAQADADSNGLERVSFFGRDMLMLGGWLRRASDTDVLVVHKGNGFGSFAEQLDSILPGGLKVSLISRKEISQVPRSRLSDVFRIWDYKLSEMATQPAWNGFAHKQINAWAPWLESERRGLSFEEIAEANVRIAQHDHPDDQRGSEGIEALAIIKGDVDNLGAVFREGMKEPTFAKMSSLSRQLNSFFAHWLPVYCREHPEFEKCYTLFAGGDDFFLIAPWRTGQQLAKSLRDEFCRFTGQDPSNPRIHLSVGIATAKAGTPVTMLGEWAEDALTASKSHIRSNEANRYSASKNAITIFEETIGWEKFSELEKLQGEIRELEKEFDLPTAWYYNLLGFLERSSENKDNPANSIWKAHLSYSTRRFVERALNGASTEQLVERTSNLIKQQIGWISDPEKRKFLKIALFNHIYSRRKS